MSLSPTEELYLSLQAAFEHFNRELFDDELPNVIFTMQRKQRCMGYFSPNRWASVDNNRYCHELAINPAYIGNSSLLTTWQTLCHEQCHLWQYLDKENRKPGRAGYHNKIWATKMEEIGLMPSSTGNPGGKKTGQSMSDYPIKGGRFLEACKSLVKQCSFNIPWVDRWAEPFDGYIPDEEILNYLNSEDEASASEAGNDSTINIASVLSTPLAKLFPDSSAEFVISAAARASPAKTKYSCPSCGTNVWGKPNLAIACAPCQVLFVATG